MNEPPKPPERRFVLDLSIGGDTRQDVVGLLRRYVGQIAAGGGECITGGYSCCGEYKIRENAEVTHDSYFALLDAQNKATGVANDQQAAGL